MEKTERQDKSTHIKVVGFNYRGYDEQISDELKRQGFRSSRTTYQGNVPIRGKFGAGLRSFIFMIATSILLIPRLLAFNWGLRQSYMRGEFDAILAVTPAFLYTWLLPNSLLKNSAIWMMDPLKLYPLCKWGFSSFGGRFTYDPADAQSADGQFLPLFADRNLYRFEEGNSGKDRYLFAFVGALYEERVPLFEHLCQIARELNKEVYFGGVFPRLTRTKGEFAAGRFPLLASSFVNRLHSHDEIVRVYRDASIIINTHKAFHQGFSMRTFEALSLNKAQMIELPTRDFFSDLGYEPYFLNISLDRLPSKEEILNFLAKERPRLAEEADIFLSGRVKKISESIRANLNRTQTAPAHPIPAVSADKN